MPAAHLVHALWPCTENWPATQAVQALAPAVPTKEPAAQLSQLVFPVLAWEVPAAQLVHCPEAADAA